MKKILFLLLFGLFVFIPKDTFAKQTYIRYYDEDYNLIISTGDSYYSNPISNVRYIRILFNDQIKSGSSYISSYDFTISAFGDYAWIYWNGSSGVNINGSYRATAPTSARTIKQDIGPAGDFLKRSYLTFKFNSTVTTTTSFFQLDLRSPREIVYFELNNYTLTESSNAETDAIINGFDNLNSNNAQNTQDIIDNQNKNQKETNEKLDKTNEELGEFNDNITSEDPPDLDALEDSAGWLPPGPVDSILNLPLTFFNNLISNLSKSCQPVEIPLPYVSKNLTLPCISRLYAQIGATTFLNWVGLIVGTIILYNYFLNLYKWIDDTIQMKDNSVDDWGGV